MDNLTHSLVGLAAAKAGLERVSPYATLICVAAANLPDIDIVTLAEGPAAYLANHRGITHSLAGALALALALPVLFVVGERLFARLRGRKPRARFKGLLICSLLLVASHPLLDWTNSYGLRPFLPWDGRWVYGDLLYIIDPWIWLTLGGACFLLTARTRPRAAAWAALACVLSLLFVLFQRRPAAGPPIVALAVWFGGLALFFALHLSSLAKRGGERVAVVSLALVALYCCALALFHRAALEDARRAAQGLAASGGERVLRVAATPTLANPLAWRCLAETDRATFRFDLTLGERDAAENPRGLLRVEKPEGAERALVERASADERARVLLGFARFPVARVLPQQDGAALVRFADLRFTEPGARARPGGFALDVPVPTGR
ncbi:MAG TPA: metal-dependent hydrolase [Pyrinomonadaceae bacterium]|nr:metal-dependent hydrolase [Pyrinomonadaceae bacterium]